MNSHSWHFTRETLRSRSGHTPLGTTRICSASHPALYPSGYFQLHARLGSSGHTWQLVAGNSLRPEFSSLRTKNVNPQTRRAGVLGGSVYELITLICYLGDTPPIIQGAILESSYFGKKRLHGNLLSCMVLDFVSYSPGYVWLTELQAPGHRREVKKKTTQNHRTNADSGFLPVSDPENSLSF